MDMIDHLVPLIEQLVAANYQVKIASDDYADWLVVTLKQGFDVIEYNIVWDEGFDSTWDYRIYNDNEELVFRSVLDREVVEFMNRA